MKVSKLKLAILIILFLSAIFSVYAAFKEERRGILTVAFLNVGQGDAILTVCSLYILSFSELSSQT